MMNDEKMIPITTGQQKILETLWNDLFPQIEVLKDLMVNIQACRVSCQIYSLKLNQLEKRYSEASQTFFGVVKKLETPDILFQDTENAKDNNMVAYFQYQSAFKQNIAEGISYVEIIDRTLDRKSGSVQNNRTLLISLFALFASIYWR
jgi:hypothetical protein